MLYPLLAKTVCLNLVLNKIKDIFCQNINRESTSDLIRLCCFIKPYITWNTRDIAAACVERSGG